MVVHKCQVTSEQNSCIVYIMMLACRYSNDLMGGVLGLVKFMPPLIVVNLVIHDPKKPILKNT